MYMSDLPQHNNTLLPTIADGTAIICSDKIPLRASPTLKNLKHERKEKKICIVFTLCNKQRMFNVILVPTKVTISISLH